MKNKSIHFKYYKNLKPERRFKKGMILHSEETIIGFIDLEDDFIMEDFIGKFPPDGKDTKSKNLIKISVYDNEGEYIPHFHFKSEKKNKLDGCVEICSRRYFIHGKHTSTLDNKACKSLNKWLKNQYKDKTYTIWQFIVATWNKNKNKIRISDNNNRQPDYSKLNEEYYYRVYTKDGVGIYEAMKKKLGYDWLSFKKSEDVSWLPNPADKLSYYNVAYESYFTEDGYNMFLEKTWKHIIQHIDPSRIIIKEYPVDKIKSKIIYRDDYQIVIKRGGY